MKTNMKVMIAAAALLAAANVVKWSGVLRDNKGGEAGSFNARVLEINCQRPGVQGHDGAVRNLFNAETGEYSGRFSGMTARRPAAVKATPVPEIKWPDFKISGVAVNEGRKCVFFTGQGFKGSVYEGSDMNESYRLSAINGRFAEITNKNTNETRKFPLEGN